MILGQLLILDQVLSLDQVFGLVQCEVTGQFLVMSEA